VSGKVGRWGALALALLLVASPSTASVAAESGARARVASRAAELGASRIAPRVGRADATPVAAPWRRSERLAAAPSTSFAFDAIARTGPNWPADPTGALGVQWVMTAVNASYALYDLAGNPVLGPNPLRSLLGVARGAEVSDPKIVYDRYGGRFVLAYLVTDEADGRSWVYVVSIPDATATDPGTWCGAKVVADRTKGDGSQRADALGLGFDQSRVAVTMDTYDFGRRRFRGATVLAFPKSRLYDCSRAIAFDTFTGRETTAPTGDRGSSLEPAVSVGQGRSLYLTSVEPGRQSFVIVWRLSGPLGSMTLRSVALRVPRMRPAPDGTQGGAAIDAAESRWDTGSLAATSTFSDLDTGRVYVAHTVGVDLEPDAAGEYLESAVRWYEIAPAGTLGASHVLRVGTIGAPQTDAAWPSVATDENGNLFVTYSRASAVTGEFLSAWIAEIAPGSTDATTQPLRIGGATFEAIPGHERWGTSTAMSRDPDDGRFVLAVNQVAVSDGSGATRDWRQVVHVVSHAP